MSNKRIYLDNASTTLIDPRVLHEVSFHLKNTFGNAGSIHSEGVIAKKVLDESRKKVAGILGAHSDEIVFTSGGTESNNLAILGTVAKLLDRIKNKELRIKNEKKIHVITSVIEHSSILECFKELEKKGVEVTYLPVTPEGIVDLVAFKKALRPETVFVSVQYANNEIGTIQPIREISKMLKHFRNNLTLSAKRYPLFHTDASQAPVYLDCNVERLGVDLLTLDGHKIYGPKGIGALYIKRGVSILPIIFGGGQERNLRAGTENVPMIAGFAKALEICAGESIKESKRIAVLRDWLLDIILNNFSKVVLNGDRLNRLPNNINISIPEIDTEFLTLQLDAKGISISTKSACLGHIGNSYVVKVLGGDLWRANNTIRITLGRFTKKSDINFFYKKLSEILKK